MTIEASFAAIERILQFYLEEKELVKEDDHIDHNKIYRLGSQTGLYGDDMRDKLIQLWKNNRSKTYYREGIGSENSASTIIDLARQIHAHILKLEKRKRDCICNCT
ncbi:MAG: hypothetical protein SVV03_00510 [Candidatus Nanohaloarchaea archaeon]|nr:hypothetical protein [Candidatus Nanohaloarchaea archaeon]